MVAKTEEDLIRWAKYWWDGTLSIEYDDRIIALLKEVYNSGIQHSSEKAEVLMTLNDIPFVSNNFSITTDHKTLDGDTEALTRKYTVFKPSILNLQIK